MREQFTELVELLSLVLFAQSPVLANHVVTRPHLLVRLRRPRQLPLSLHLFVLLEKELIRGVQRIDRGVDAV